MISLDTAIQLKNAGLLWIPSKYDFFALPDRDLDHLLFVISDMTINVELLSGYPVVTFNGASEWALDYVTIRDVVWLPREEQLRAALEDRLNNFAGVQMQLVISSQNYTCKMEYGGSKHSFKAPDASEAYASALLFLLGENSVKFTQDGKLT